MPRTTSGSEKSWQDEDLLPFGPIGNAARVRILLVRMLAALFAASWVVFPGFGVIDLSVTWSSELAAGARGGLGPLLHGARRRRVRLRRHPAALGAAARRAARGRGARARRVRRRRPRDAARLGRRAARARDARRGMARRLLVALVGRARRVRADAGARSRRPRPVDRVRARHVGSRTARSGRTRTSRTASITTRSRARSDSRSPFYRCSRRSARR